MDEIDREAQDRDTILDAQAIAKDPKAWDAAFISATLRKMVRIHERSNQNSISSKASNVAAGATNEARPDAR